MRFKSEQDDLEEDQVERLFFHDIINHTHGLLLFFSQKEALDRGLTAQELALVRQELEALQAIIKQQSPRGHRGLHSAKEWISFAEFQPIMLHLVRTYLPATKFKFSLEIQAPLMDSVEQLHLATFYRIIHNIVKNIAENGAGEVRFSFGAVEGQLQLLTSNRCRPKTEEIARTTNEASPQGIASIAHLCALFGGSYAHTMADHDTWINHVCLPLLGQNQAKKSA